MSESNKYILYTNDGKSWTVVDQYVAPDTNRYYFACASASANNENTSYRYPGGFIAFARSTPEDLVLFTGISNYLPMSHGTGNPNTSLDEMKTKVQTLITKCINAGARPGVVPKCKGLSQIWSFSAADKDTIDRTKFRVDKSTGSTGLRIEDIYSGGIDVRTTHKDLTRWANSSDAIWKTGQGAFGSSILSGWNELNGWKTYNSVLLFITLIYSHRVYGDAWGQAFTDRRDTVYSDSVGFAPGWYGTHVWNQNFFQIDGTWEAYHIEPTTDSGAGSKIGFRWGGPIHMTMGNLIVSGLIRADLVGYDWPVGTGELTGAQFPPAGSQYNKLCAKFNIDNVGSSIDHWIPYANRLEVNVLVTEITTGKRYFVKCNGRPDTFQVTEL